MSLAPMLWGPLEDVANVWRSDVGYQVCLEVSRPDGRLQRDYVAWSPVVFGWRSRLKAHYRRGERMPQPRELIGVYPDFQQAADACEGHRKEESDAA